MTGFIAEITDVNFGYYSVPDGRAMGVAIGWKSATEPAACRSARQAAPESA
jgi:hypothetical protein